MAGREQRKMGLTPSLLSLTLSPLCLEFGRGLYSSTVKYLFYPAIE
jgi:hypothetical protein